MIERERAREERKMRKRRAPDNDALILLGPREGIVRGISNGEDMRRELSNGHPVVLFHGIQAVESSNGAVGIHGHKNVAHIRLE